MPRQTDSPLPTPNSARVVTETNTEPPEKHTASIGRRWGRFLGVLGTLLLVGGAGYLAYRYFRDGEESTSRSATTTVSVATAEQATWQTKLSAVGTITPIQGTELTSELAGKVASIHFDSGDRVDQGEVLVRLDIAREQAELETLRPQLLQAKQDRERAEELIESNAISEEAFEEAFAEVDRLRARIRAREATIDRKIIQAPFSGVLGIRMVNLGAYLQPGTSVTTLQQIAPIFVDFDLPEQRYDEVASGQPIRLRVDAFPGRSFRGTVQTIAPRIEQRTRNFTVRAKLANEDRLLKPGMFAEVQVLLADRRDVVTVPATAVSLNAYGNSVYVVETNQQGEPVAQRTFVETGPRRDLRIEIVKGIRAGDRIVTAGQLKLGDRTRIRITEQNLASNAPRVPSEP
jgi:membrane fusion protein (multidrug efflux system)